MFSTLPPWRQSVDERGKDNLLLLHIHINTHTHTQTTCTILGSLLMERAYLTHGAKVVLARRLLRARPRYELFDVKLFECNYIFGFGPELPQALFETMQGLFVLFVHFHVIALLLNLSRIFVKVGTFISTCTFAWFKYNRYIIKWRQLW